MSSSICIVGIGLMGASFAMALKAKKHPARLIGVSRSEETKRKALERGIVDDATTDLLNGAKGADVIVLCTPVRLIVEQIQQLSDFYKKSDSARLPIITDMGSTKTEIVNAMNMLPEHVFAVGSHPMCGKETAGIDVAEANLYEGATWILSRTKRTNDEVFEKIKSLAEIVGAKTREIDAERHDALLAFASHLPYAVSTAMVNATDHFSLSHPDVWQTMAGGFRDTSRVAASDVTMWLDILLTNRNEILSATRDFQFQVDQFTAMLERKDEAGLKSFLESAAQARRVKFGR
jgi:prephenate dehydrogenase